MTGFLATESCAPDVAGLAEEALWLELALTPKPGLVDRLNNGSHRDMDHAMFARSIIAIAPWFPRFTELGYEHADKPAEQQLRLIRPMGIACEQAMYAATGGVNTHKGGIFALGLLCFAAGRVSYPNARRLCTEVSRLCQGLVARELASGSGLATAGERQYQQFGLTGARGEAESGFATVRQVLACWQGGTLHELLLHLLAVNQDTNLVARGGMEGLRYVQGYARQLLAQGWDRQALSEMDQALIARNLSPGGSADLLSVGWVLAGCG
ncbi:triphosphoribosyl-dephospho-CoA synthase CitG [Pantoea sp. C2G6]|uniref:triphosphoribosyl-dephospho-CoA synthase CitG n=1 Tax=Pantoea sp. C2G6 TaxID=3243084 RepID=UPI003ED972EB